MEYQINYQKKAIFIDISLHLLISLLLGFFIYWQFHSIGLSGLCLLSGVFIDLDHLIDYFICFGIRNRPRCKILAQNKWSKFIYQFFSGEYLESGKVYFFLHSWEIVIGFSLLAVNHKMTLPVLAISLGYIGHLLIDNCLREIKPFGYFLTYRIMQDFKLEEFYPAIIVSSAKPE